jgi:hypothetical protein
LVPHHASNDQQGNPGGGAELINAPAVGERTHMFADTETWNPFQGCRFDCSYCRPSFQRQAKRQKGKCSRCREFAPHVHYERIDIQSIPNSPTVFVCGNSDVAFCEPNAVEGMLDMIKDGRRSHPETTYYLQSKKPDCFISRLPNLPRQVVLVTTLETNRDEGYDAISKAPPPSERYRQFLALDYPRKVVTVEPVMDFDLDIFSEWLIALRPEYVWLGLNSRPKEVQLPEPTEAKLRLLVVRLLDGGIEVRAKDLRGWDVGLPPG